jgi:hypothetical protein
MSAFPEKERLKEAARLAVLTWRTALSHRGLGLEPMSDDEIRALHKSALDALAAVRPGKAVTIHGIRYFAATSRNQITTQMIARSKGK